MIPLKHKVTNRIHIIQCDREKLDKDQDIKEEIVGYFSNLLMIDNNLKSLDKNDLITSIPSRIDDILNKSLNSILSSKVTKQHSPLKEKSPLGWAVSLCSFSTSFGILFLRKSPIFAKYSLALNLC